MTEPRSPRGNRGVAISLAIATMAMLALSPSGATAAPSLLGEFCDGATSPVGCRPSRAAVDPATGDVYVIDGMRIDKFTIWGQFVKAWGGGVISGGATGLGTVTAGSDTVTSAVTISKSFASGMKIEGTGIAPGTTVAFAEPHTLTLSQPATADATGLPTTITSPEGPGNAPVNELQRIAVTATAGTYKLRFESPRPGNEIQATTANLPYNASAAEVQSALEGLANIGTDNVAVSSPNPGGEAGVPGGPYTVEFKGDRYADTNVLGLQVVEGDPALSGGVATTEPMRQGAGSPEVCTGSDCVQGVDGIRAGQIASPRGIAVDSTGSLYVYESPDCIGGVSCEETFNITSHGPARVQKFDADGNFLLIFGKGVNEGGGAPSNPGDICTAQDVANGDVCGGGVRGEGDGEFGIGPLTGGTDVAGNFITIGPGDKVYVGGKERIQHFDASGHFGQSVALPGETPQSLAADPTTENLYATYHTSASGRETKEGVRRLSPSGAVLAVLPALEPTALAVDAAANLYVANAQLRQPASIFPEVEIQKFDSGGTEDPAYAFSLGTPTGSSNSFNTFGLAAGSACGIPGADIYATSFPTTFVRAYGPPPNPTLCPPPSVAPTISEQFATTVDSTGATVKAKINPHFWPDARYYVEYGTGKCSEGGCDRKQPAAPGSKLTTTTTSQSVATAGVFLPDLTPGTTYHYRFVAQSSGGGPVRGAGGEVGSDGIEGTLRTFSPASQSRTDCPNQGFRVGGSGGLPDCRAYEMVSPLDKNGGDADSGSFVGALTLGSSNGNRVSFSALRSFGEPQGAPVFSQYLSSRGADGWSTQAISPPRANPAFLLTGGVGHFKAFSDDLCSAWLLHDAPNALAPEAPERVVNLYRRDLCGEGGYELLTSVAPPGFDFKFEVPETSYYPNPQGHSADNLHSAFRADANLTSNACTKIKGERGTNFQVYETSLEGPLRLVSVLPNGKATCTDSSVGMFAGVPDDFYKSSVYNAVSDDGSRVFWSANGVSGGGFLYVRLNAAQRPSKPGSKCAEAERACTLAISKGPDAYFWGADPRGHTAIYTEGDELREFNVDTAESELIATGVKGVAGMSEDASRVYFVANGNLYFYERGEVGGDVTFVASLSQADLFNTSTESGRTSPIAKNTAVRSARVTPDGLHIAFGSTAPITGYDNRDAASGRADGEIYLYDANPAGSPQLACISCNPSGARPVGRMVVGGEEQNQAWAAAILPGWAGQLNPTRLLSANGDLLFFESFEALVPGDTNGKKDVYEWERAGDAQACRSAGAQLFAMTAGGCLSLISSGQSPDDSELIDASQDGSDVFIATGSSLLPQDPGLVDIYDARMNGGFPLPPAPAPSCEGEACQGAIAPPNDATPASSSFEGAGNVVEPSKKNKKNKKKKARKKKAHKRAQNRANDKRRATR